MDKAEIPRDDALDALIVGGGMIGLALGCALGAARLRAAVVDPSALNPVLEMAVDGRVSAVSAAGVRLLSAIGAWPRIARSAEPILDIRVSDGDSPLFLHFDHRALAGDGGPLGYIVENRVIRVALLERARAIGTVRLIGGETVVSVTRGPAKAVIRLASGGTIAAPLAIAADGKDSPSRRAAGIAATEWRYEQTGIVCTVAHERPHRGIAQERFLPAGPFAILPMTGQRSSIVWTERAALAPGLLALDEADFAAELGRRFGDYLGAIRVVGPRYHYPLSLVHAETYIAPRLALVGDAAHAIHPIAGQGFNIGLRDVAALAEVAVDAARLGLDIGSTAVLQRYQRWRRFDNSVMLAVTDGLNRLFSNDHAAIALGRDLGLAAVERVPALKRLMMRHAMGLAGDLPRLLRGEAL